MFSLNKDLLGEKLICTGKTWKVFSYDDKWVCKIAEDVHSQELPLLMKQVVFGYGLEHPRIISI